MSLKDKVVLVTGGSSGMGAAIAAKFTSKGAKVAIVGRNAAKLQEVSAKNGNKPHVIVADLINDEDVKRIISETISHYGQLDVLVNNAGCNNIVSFLAENAMDTFDQIMLTNLRSAVLLTNIAAPHLIKTKGNVVNISSISALRPYSVTGFSYDTSKAALEHFTRCVALELGPKGVRVNAVSPGPVKSDLVGSMGISAEEAQLIYESVKKGTLLDKVADPEEVADLVYYLASNKARSVTGASFVIDNGANLNS